MNKRTFTINGQEKEAVWVEREGQIDAHWEVDGIWFDGHRELWSFRYEPKTYLKESELSGEQWRKGGSVLFYRDGIQVYESFCRNPERAAMIVLETLPKLQEINWEKVKEGTKLYYRDVPAKVGYVMMDQGAFMLLVDGVDEFPKTAWMIEDNEEDEDKKEVKVDILDPKIWWWRK